MIAALLTDFLGWDISISDALLGAILGGALAIVASLLAQLLSLEFQRESYDTDKKEKNTKSATSLQIRLTQAVARVSLVLEHFDTAVAKVDGTKNKLALQATGVLENLPRLEFSDHENEIAMTVLSGPLKHDFVSFADRYNSIAESSNNYYLRRSDFLGKYFGPVENGVLSINTEDDEESQRINYEVERLDILAKGILREAIEVGEQGKNLLVEIAKGMALSGKYKSKYFELVRKK